MNENIEAQLHNIYNEIMEKPNRIKEIFEDFYDVSRIDMQGFLTYEKFVEYLSTLNIGNYFSIDCVEMRDLNIVDKSLVNSLILEGAEKETLFSDNAITTVFLPIIKSSVAEKFFNNIFILVHFPHVTITNEHNRSIDIKHLWAKVQFSWTGRGKGYFGLNRSEYPAVQFRSNYMHSHVYSIPENDFTKFATPCTGTGPINSTLSTLSVDFDDAIWQLFCLELDKYVRVESIAGVPYHKLESVGAENLIGSIDSFTMRTLFKEYPSHVFWEDKSSRFIKHLLESKILSFNYQNNQYGLAMSFIEFVVAISNNFIEWYNKEFNEGIVTNTFQELIDSNILKKVIIKEERIIYIDNTISTSSEDISQYIGKKVCTFKGRDITLNITGLNSNTIENESIILNLGYIELILGGILRLLNYSYGKENRTERRSEETTSFNSTKKYF